MKILFKLTTRGRPDNFYKTLDSIFNNCVSDDYMILVTLDNDDPKLPEYKKSFFSPVPMFWRYGKNVNKIEAINRDVNEFDYDWDILVNVSDDQVFIKKGFDEDIRDAFIITKGEDSGNIKIKSICDLDQFIHFPDGNRTDLATMSIMGRDYYNRDKYIYYPEYVTECSDDEAQEVAKIRGCYKYVDLVILNHLHPAYGKGEWDSNYAENLTLDKQSKDRQLLEYRRSINFGL